MIDILRRDPRKAYYNNVLWMPKTHVSEMQLRSSLTYELTGDKDPYEAWNREAEHYLVPRNYLPNSILQSLPFPVVDARIKSFPSVHFKSNVVLDFKNPGEHYQRDGVTALLAVDNGILCLRCGAGKSVCGIHAIHCTHVPGLIIVNEKGLAEQWVEEILAFTDLRRDDIGFIGEGKFSWQKKLAVGLGPTIAARVRDGRLPRELIEHFGVTLADEAHTTAGPAFYHLAMTPFHGRRWGLTATPRRNDAFDSLLRYTMGEVVYSHLMPEITPLIYFRRLPTRLNLRDQAVFDAVTDITGEVHLQKLYGYLATRNDRCSVIIQEAKTALKQKRQVLLLSQSRAMVERLGDAFPGSGVIHGDVTKDRLKLLRERNPVIAIAKLARQALNKPELDTLLVCEPFSDPGVLQQLLGRIQRPHPTKQRAMAVFYDDIYVQDIHKICMKIRALFNRWPENQGGRLAWKAVGEESAT